MCMFIPLTTHHYTHRPSIHPASDPSLPSLHPFFCIVRPLVCSFDHCKSSNIYFLALYSGHLVNYDLGDVIGYGSFGHVVAATRKADSLPVRTEQWSLGYARK